MDFHSTEEAKEYLKMNGMEFRGQYLNIDLASNKHQCEICTLYGGGFVRREIVKIFAD